MGLLPGAGWLASSISSHTAGLLSCSKADTAALEAKYCFLVLIFRLNRREKLRKMNHFFAKNYVSAFC
jgi:hypothetical protein